MIEEFKYKDKIVGKNEKDEGSLKNLVNEEFKNIERKNGVGYRDDQEIRNAGRNICNKIIKEIQKDKTKVYGSRALEPLTKLISALKTEYNNMKGMKLFTNNEDKINQVAQRIDNAENETLKRLAKNRTTQDSRDIVKKGNEIHKDKPMFLMEGGNDVKKQTGNIIFTEAANPVKIHEALKGLFTNPNIVYEIDYSRCDTSTPKGKAIKEKMTNLMGTQTCYLRYDSNQKTYTIRDKNGIGISDRAYIRQGVKLIPAGVRQWQSYVEEKKGKENLGNIDNTQINKLTESMLKDMPSAGKLTQTEQEDLVKKTENRVTDLLKKAKELGYDLESECITKKHFGRGHMELHLNSGSSEVDRTVRGNNGSYNKILGEKLDNFIDSNEGEYKTYLTNRVKAKWQELDKLTKTETSNISKKWGKDGWKNLDPKEREEKEQEAEQHKQDVLYGIGLLERMVDNYKETEGDSWLDSDDRKLVQIKQLIRNAKSSINNADILDDNALIKNFINPIWEKWSSFKNMANTYRPQYNLLMKVFFGERQDQISAIRSLGGRNRIFDNTETSFLAEEIEGNDDLTVKNADIQKCLDNIKNRTTMSIYNQDGSINQKVKGRYDNTYASARKGTDSLITLFVGRGWLPENWKDEEKEVRKCMDNLRDKLNYNNDKCNNISLSVDDMIKTQHEKRLKLEQKENKTEDDIKILQSLVYLEENPKEARESYQKAIELNNIELKYGSLGQIVKGGLLSALGELGGGITGKNADIYNDIKGYGWFDLSDENAKVAGDLIGDILEEVVILTVAIAIGTVTAGTGTAIIMGARATRWGAKAAKYTKYVTKLTNKLTKPIGNIIKKSGNIAKTSKIGQKTAKVAERAKNTKLGKNISKIRTQQNAAKAATSQENRAEILHLWRKENKTLGEMYKLGSLVNKEGGMGIKAAATIFEGTGFHISNIAIHNAINGVDLNTGLNPFGYTEGPNGEKISNFKGYVQSIAFLKILKILGQPIQNLTQASLTSVLGEKISANTFGKFLQNIGSITGEFGSLTVTDEAINVVFEGELKELTVEDAIHSIGMILGLRAYGKIKQIANLKIKEYNRNKKELKAEIDGKEIIVNEDMIDKLSNENKGTEIPQKNRTNEPLKNNVNEKVVDKATEQLHEKFDQEIMSENGITIDGITYKLERRPNEGHNPNRKGRIVYTETGPDGKVRVKVEANSDTFSLPENSNGNNIRERYNAARGKYVERNLNSILESARKELDGELSRNIDSRSKDLEGRRRDRTALEGKKKNLSDEIDGLKSRKAKLEQQLQKISKELTIQPDISSLKDIEAVFFAKAGRTVSIGGVKCKFNGIVGNKIQFIRKGGGKPLEFSSFKEIKEAGIKFDIDINVKQEKNRTEKTYDKQKEIFEELVKKEARTKNASEIIREYEQLQNQKSQLEQDIRDGFFRENADRLVSKHIWIDSVEYQCTGKNTNNGKTTLDFKKTDGSDHFTISSFEQLKTKGKQLKGFKVLKTNQPRFETENDALLQRLLNGEPEYINKKKQELQQIDQQLQNGRADYDNVKLATSPKKVPNPEYDRIQKEIEGIDEQLIKKGEELTNLERDLGTSADEITKIEKEIADLKAQKDNLSRANETGDITGNEGNGGDVIENEIREEINNSEDVANKFNEIKTEAESANYDNIKLDWVTQKMFETGTYIEGVHRRFKNLSLKPNTKLPKEFLRKMRESLKEFKTKCRNNLSEKYKKLVDRYNEFFEKKLREEGNEIEIKKEEIDIIEKSSKTFGEYNQEFADIIRNNQNKIINLEKIENMDSFINESFKFLKEEMGIDDPNLKIKILEGTEGIDNHYDRSTNTVYFSRNFGGERQIYLKGGNKAETFGGIGHELNHYLQEVEIIKHYLKDNETINTFVEGIMNESDKEWINRYINQIDFNEPISERAIKYAKYYTEAGKDKTIFDKNGKILDHNKYRNLGYEKESFDRGDILADEYRKTTKSYREQQRKQREEQQRKQREEQERKQREEQERRQKEEQQRKQQEEQQRKLKEMDIENNKLKLSDIEIYTNITKSESDLGNTIAREYFEQLIKRKDIVAKAGDNRLCINLNGKTCFIKQAYDERTGSRPLNKIIRVNREIPPDICKTILENGKIFEVYDGKILKSDIVSYINEILEKGSLKEQVRKQREGQLKTENLEGTFTYMMDTKNGKYLEGSSNMQVQYKGELYNNGMLKKGEKILPNGLVVEKGEYDINGNMIKGEKYIYEARLYDGEGMPITNLGAYKKTIFKGSSNDNIIIKGKINRMGEYTDTERLSYIIENEYGHIALEGIGDKTFIFHAGMHAKGESPTEREILQAERAAGKAFHELAATIPEGYKITETLSLSGDSFPLFLREYQRDFRTDYTVRATGKMIPLNSQGLNTPESKLIQSKDVGKDDRIFEAATQADAQEVADAINKLMKDRGQPLVEGQGIKELAEARVYKSFETGLWRVKIPQIEMVKEYNNGVELAQQLNKCKTYGELENILLSNLSTEYHFRDGTLTGRDLLNRFTAYRDTYINGGDAFPRNIDPRRFFPSEFIEPAKRKSKGIPTRRNTTRKSNVHKLLDSK